MKPEARPSADPSFADVLDRPRDVPGGDRDLSVVRRPVVAAGSPVSASACWIRPRALPYDAAKRIGEPASMQQQFDRAAEDLGNSIHLEHVNVQVPDQRLATLFYVTGLGLTRDPYLMVSDTNMWINVGRSQFHLPSGDAAGAARPYRPRHLRPRGPARAARRRRHKAGRHRLRLQRAQRLCRGDLPVGQSRALL